MLDSKKILISVCVPVYNRERYLKHCIESIFTQKIDSDTIEFLFFDDGSTDNSKEIINEVIKNNTNLNIRLISNTVNQGLWNARNTLYEQARGEYILCVDADDALAPNILNSLLYIVTDTNPDIIIFPYSEIDEHGNIIKEIDSKYSDIKSTDINKFPIDTYHFSICNKLVRTKLIQNLGTKVPKGVNCWEDLSITSRIYVLAKKIIVMHETGYYYRKHNSESYSSRDHKKILEEHLVCTDFISNWLKTNGIEQDYCDFLNHLKFAAKIKMLRGSSFEYKRWKTTYPESNKIIMTMPGVPLLFRIIFTLLSKI
ncbi:MAG: glycosyltransferase family 2 protein [Muribaculaceae bacterium]|nr:glycosyltransferase family 2 protein [Muribaculaceae bacterium]